MMSDFLAESHQSHRPHGTPYRGGRGPIIDLDHPVESFLAVALLLLLLLLLFLGRFQRCVVNVPNEYCLEDEADNDEEQGGEELGLVVEDSDSLVGGSDLLEEIEVDHGDWGGFV